MFNNKIKNEALLLCIIVGMNLFMIINFAIILKTIQDIPRILGISLYTMIMLCYLLLYFKKYRKTEKIIRLLTVYLFISNLIIFIIYYLTKIVVLTDYYGFKNILEQYGNKAELVYFGISLLQPIALPLPEPVTIMAGSSVFGAFKGALIGFSGTIIGIVSMYFFVRTTGAKFIDKFVSNKQIEKFNEYIKKNELIVILLLFILPILPDEAICMGAGLTKINSYKFISIAIISKLITSFSLSYSINIIKLNIFTLVIVVVFILVAKKLFDFIKNKKIKQS